MDTLWNGNEKWIEIGQQAANNGADSYSWNTAGLAPGNYYVGGYLYDNATGTPKFSHLTTAITVRLGVQSFILTGPDIRRHVYLRRHVYNWSDSADYLDRSERSKW